MKNFINLLKVHFKNLIVNFEENGIFPRLYEYFDFYSRTGSVIGWRVDPQKQLAVIFHHELKDELRGLVFCSNPDDHLGKSGFKYIFL